MLQTAFTSGVDIPEEWINDCLASRIGVLHKERAVRPSAPLLGGPPFVLLFFPHIFVADDSSSDNNVGGGVTLPAEHTVLPPLGEEVGERTPHLTQIGSTAPSHDALTSVVAVGARYDAVPDSEEDGALAQDTSAGSPTSSCRWLRHLLLLAGSVFLPGTRLSLGLQVLVVAKAVQIHSAPASPRDVVLAPAAALDSARLATPSAHRRLQSLWHHFGDFGHGSLWPVPGSTAHSLRFSIKLWHPEHPHTVELLGNTDAATAAAEVRALAGRTSRTHVFAAAGGLPAGQVHLVAAPRDRSHVTVFFDAGVEVWCADVPRHTNPEYLLHVACSLASTDALQISSTVSTPLRNGDVLGVRLETDPIEVDLSGHLLAQPGASASTWLDPVRYFTLLTATSGATTYQIARSAEVDVHLLRGLVRHVEGPGGTFLELPFGALLRRPIWVHCASDLDHVVFRVTEAWDPHDDGLFFVFRGTFPTYVDFVRSLRQDPSPGAQWIRAIRPYGTTVLSWEYMHLHRPRGPSLWVVHCSADITRAQFHHVHYRSRQQPILSLRTPPPWPRAQRQASRGIPFLTQPRSTCCRELPFGRLYLGQSYVSSAVTLRFPPLWRVCGALRGRSAVLFRAYQDTHFGPSGMVTACSACALLPSPGTRLPQLCTFPCGSSHRHSCMVTVRFGRTLRISAQLRIGVSVSPMTLLRRLVVWDRIIRLMPLQPPPLHLLAGCGQLVSSFSLATPGQGCSARQHRHLLFASKITFPVRPRHRVLLQCHSRITETPPALAPCRGPSS